MEGGGSQAGSADKAARSRSGAVWLLVPLFAVAELSGHAAVRLGVPGNREWREAAGYVRQHYRAGDAITTAPDWADPLLRWVLGDRIPASVVGRSDLAGQDRLWALTARNALPADAPARRPDFEKAFGRIRVARWDLPPSAVLADLVQGVAGARVSMVRDGAERDCPMRRMPPGGGGGLGQGPLPPADRFVCPGGRDLYWVAPVVMEDLDLRPRYCVRQSPLGPEPVRVLFEEVELGDRLVLYGGLYYEDERNRQGKPVRVEVRVEGELAGTMVHRDGEGWKRQEISTRVGSRRGDTGRVAIEVTADDPRRRTFCWAATTRRDRAQEKR